MTTREQHDVKQVSDFLGMTTMIAAFVLLVSPRRLSRRERFVRFLRRTLRLHVEPIEPRGATVIKDAAANLAAIMESTRR